jgi:hypothetical protein
VFPLTIGSASLVSDGQDDIGNPSNPICFCSNPPRIGVSIGFWEPVRLVDVTRTPFCMVGLGGIAIDPGIEVPRGAQVGHDSQTRNSFYQVHWYTNPILYWLEVLLDFPCLEKGSLDLVYLTEVDPLWADDELTAILNPEAVLFANAPAKAACAADCVASTAGLGIASLFWPRLDLSNNRTRCRPHRRRTGFRPAHPAHDREDAPAARHLRRRRSGGHVRLLHAADHGQDPLQAADGLSRPQHTERRWPVLPALRAHDDDLGRRQVVPGLRRRLFVPNFPQEELLCQRILTVSWPSP